MVCQEYSMIAGDSCLLAMSRHGGAAVSSVRVPRPSLPSGRHMARNSHYQNNHRKPDQLCTHMPPAPALLTVKQSLEVTSPDKLLEADWGLRIGRKSNFRTWNRRASSNVRVSASMRLPSFRWAAILTKRGCAAPCIATSTIRLFDACGSSNISSFRDSALHRGVER